MDRDQLLELVPHYIAMLILVFAVLAVVRELLGDIGFWAELVVVAIVVFGYRPLVRQLDMEPSAWKDQR